jgi:adenosylcobyric acid synthase
MRGDLSLFEDGMKLIALATDWPALGLVPFFEAARALPAEDAYDLGASKPAQGGGKIKVAVPLLPRIANFNDLDPLGAEPDIELTIVKRGSALPVCDLIVLPGSKATIADLEVLREEGWDIDIAAHARRGGYVLGLCGGYQMLGTSIADPQGIEGAPRTVPGLELLDVETTITGDKTLTEMRGVTISDDAPVEGYEMHMGTTGGPGTANPFIRFADGTTDGAVSANGRVAGTYLHGFFNDDRQRAAWIERLGGKPSLQSHEQRVEETLDALARHLEAHIDVDLLLTIAR